MKLSPEKAMVVSYTTGRLLQVGGEYVRAVDLDISQPHGFVGDPMEGFSAGDDFEWEGENGIPKASGEILEISRTSFESLIGRNEANARVVIAVPVVPRGSEK